MLTYSMFKQAGFADKLRDAWTYAEPVTQKSIELNRLAQTDPHTKGAMNELQEGFKTNPPQTLQEINSRLDYIKRRRTGEAVRRDALVTGVGSLAGAGLGYGITSALTQNRGLRLLGTLAGMGIAGVASYGYSPEIAAKTKQFFS